MSFKIKTLKLLPPSLEILAHEASSEDFHFLFTLIDEWRAGKSFNKEGELLLGAFDNDKLVGIAGINQDPYLADPSIGRVRRFYISKDYRRKGVGKQLLTQIIEHGKTNFTKLTLRTETDRGAAFYEDSGFRKSELKDCSHEMTV